MVQEKALAKTKKEKESLELRQERLPEEAIPQETVLSKVVGLLDKTGTIKLTEKQKEILFAPVNAEDVEIREDGIIYLPWMEYVTRLRDAFSGKWAIIPTTLKPQLDSENNSLAWGFYLFIDGKPYGYAIGEQKYFPNNPTMTWSDACEGAKSNALMRLCKGLGISLELWRPSFVRGWKKKYAESYYQYDKRKGKDVLKWQKKPTTEEPAKEKPKSTAKPPSKTEKPEPEPQTEEKSEPKKPDKKLATEDQKDSIIGMCSTLTDKYGREPDELDEAMKAHLKKFFKRDIEKIPDDCTQKEATNLMKCLHLSIQEEFNNSQKDVPPEPEEEPEGEEAI